MKPIFTSAGKFRERAALWVLDLLVFTAFYTVYYYVRVESGWFAVPLVHDYWAPMIVSYIYWLGVFLFFGLYRPWHARSRVDEWFSLFKAVSSGCIVLFFAIFLDDLNTGAPPASRLLVFLYWFLLIISLGSARMFLRSARRRLLERGIGLQNAIIIGWNDKARELHDLVIKHPALGYRPIGFLKVDRRKGGKEYKGTPVLGHLDDLSDIVRKRSVLEILIALSTSDHNKLLDIIASCSSVDVRLKIMPDMYDIISGQARTNQIYGFPLIEIMPDIMQPWEQSAKRLMDIAVSIIVLILSAPMWIAIAIAIKLDSRGPIVYSQERVGKDRNLFKMYKFRSMRADAEKGTGPVWAPEKDIRVTKVGRLLRKLRLDEIPQFINVLDGDMSLVGPRPERPFFVEKLSKEIPLYMRRLKVRPGITGWAQVKQGYDRNIEDVKSKVRYDLFYIENMSLRMDFKIIIYTFYVMIAGRGQ